MKKRVKGQMRYARGGRTTVAIGGNTDYLKNLANPPASETAISIGGSALSTAGAGASIGSMVGGPLGAGIGAGAGAILGGITGYIGKRRATEAAEKALAERRALNLTLGTQAISRGNLEDGVVNPETGALSYKSSAEDDYTGGLKDGGKIKGPGTGKSDSIPAKLGKNGFIVPVENAKVAENIRAKFFPDTVGKKAPVNTSAGKTKIRVSDGEHYFTPEEVKVLQKNGVNLNVLAPNAKPGNKFAGGGTVKIGNKEYDLSDLDFVRTGSKSGEAVIKSKRTGYELTADEKKEFWNLIETGDGGLPKLDDKGSFIKKQGVSNANTPQRDSFEYPYLNLFDQDIKKSAKKSLLRSAGPAGHLLSLGLSLGEVLNPDPESDETRELRKLGRGIRQPFFDDPKSEALRKEGSKIYPGSKPQMVLDYESRIGTPLNFHGNTTDPLSGLGTPSKSNGASSEDTVTSPDSKYNFAPFIEAENEFNKIKYDSPTPAVAMPKLGVGDIGTSKNELIVPDAAAADAAMKNATGKADPSFQNKMNFSDKLNLGISAGQTLLGTIGTVFGKDRPEVAPDPLLAARLNESLAEEKYGFTPAKKKIYSDQIDADTKGSNINAVELSGGNRNIAMALINKNQIDADKAKLRLAVADEDIKRQKRMRTDQYVSAVSADKRYVENNKLAQFDKNQASYEQLLNVGLQNVIGLNQYQELKNELRTLRRS